MHIKQLVIAIILMTTVHLLIAQKTPGENKHYYVSEDGKLYWPAEKPVYIFASPDGSEEEAVQMTSASTPQYANPMYLDEEGLNLIVTKWAVDPETLKPVNPPIDVVYEIYRDGNAPKTSYQLTGAKSYKGKDHLYYGPGLKLLLSVKDELSGVQYTGISINQEEFKDYPEVLDLGIENYYQLEFYSRDHVGNEENHTQLNFVTDITPPVTNYMIKGDRMGNTFSPRTTMTMEAYDQKSGVNKIYYQIDNGPKLVYQDAIGFSQLKDGEHKVVLFSEDMVGNVENQQTVNFYMDAVAPEIRATVIGEQYQNRGRVFVSTRSQVKLEASDNQAGVKKLKYQIDNQQEKEYREPFDLPKDQGVHQIKFYAIDYVNNDYKTVFDESKSGRQALDIDMTPPKIAYEYVGYKVFTRDTMFIGPTTQIAIHASDAEAGIKNSGYKINDNKGVNYEAPFTIQERGFYEIDFYSTDLVNNRNTDKFNFVLDNQGPEIQTVFSTKPQWKSEAGIKTPIYTLGTKIYLAATDNLVDTRDIQYSLDGQPKTNYTIPLKLNVTGKHSLQVWVSDQLGNQTTSEKYEFHVQ